MTNKQTTWEEVLTGNSVSKLVDLVKYPVMNQKTKPQIKKLFETLFNVNVVSVNTHIPPRKKIRVGMAQGFRPRYKRAIITLIEGQSINYEPTGVSNQN